MEKYKVLLAVFMIFALSLAASKVVQACGDEYGFRKPKPEETVDIPEEPEKEVEEDAPKEITEVTIVEEPSEKPAEETPEEQEPEQPAIVPEEPVVVPEEQVVKEEQPVQIVYQVVKSDNDNDDDDEDKDDEDKEEDDNDDKEELAALTELPKTGNPALGSILGSFMIGMGTLLRKKK